MLTLERYILDLGSHSAKLYRLDPVKLIDVITWEILENAQSREIIGETLERLLSSRLNPHSEVRAIGTAALRRDPDLKSRVEIACRKLNIHFKTISQIEELGLIRSAVANNPDFNAYDVINVGGGSIQIHSPLSDRSALLPFGISDLRSPFDPKWIRGAIASNCVVLASLEKSAQSEFKPTDLNIADGWLGAL